VGAELAAAAAASHEPRGGHLRTDKTYSDLLTAPLGSVLSVAALRFGREYGLLLERNPFAGLAAQQPVRALAAITRTIDGQEHVRWGWQTLLSFQARQHDKPRFVVLLARRLAHVPDTILTDILGAATFWLEQSRKVLFEADPEGCVMLWDRLVGVLERGDPALRASNVRGQRREWVTEAINASAGKLAETLMADPQLNSLPVGSGLPPEFSPRAERLLRLGDEAGRHALVVFGLRLNWFFAVDVAWTEANLLSTLNRDGDGREALISGFLHGPRVSSRPFYARLLPTVIECAVAPPEPAFLLRTPASNVLLGGWLTVDDETGERWLSSGGLRDVIVRTDNNVRTHMLWQVARWSSVADKIEFLTAVWPRQTVAKNPAVTRRLCEVALHDADHFPELLDAVIPRMSRPDGSGSTVPHFGADAEKVLKQFPEKFLTMVWEILPEDATKWPYGTNATVDLIGETDPALLHDARLIELRRRWNARQM